MTSDERNPLSKSQQIAEVLSGARGARALASDGKAALPETAKGCRCGQCPVSQVNYDGHGNIDYGFSWDEAVGDYVARDCPVAELRREISRTY